MTTERGKRGLTLCGGGITGAMYQVGCIAALEEGLEDFRLEDFDVFVGSSTGAVVAMFLAGGLSPMRLYRALLDPGDDFFPLQRRHVMRLDLGEWTRVGKNALSTFRYIVSQVSSRPLETDLGTELDGLWDSLPAGLFTLDNFETFLNEFFSRRNLPGKFGDFQRKLVVVASDLDRGSRATFGLGDLADVDVAQALCAAVAVPLLYAPYRVQGRDYIEGGAGDMAHVDIAHELGSDLIIAINPNVPARLELNAADVPTGHGRGRRVRDKGGLWIYDQAWRMRTEMRLRSGIDHFSRENPSARVALLEPAQEDITMFMHSPMNFSARRAILQNAFTATLSEMRRADSPLRRALETSGLQVKA